MTTIVPRWEWRTFATRFGPEEAAFAALTPEETKDSDELYLLAPGGANVKVRDDLMDIKVLQKIDTHGLEQWIPVMKQGFPLVGSDVAKVFDALGVAVPRLDRDAYSLDQLLDELVEPSTAIRAVEVHKHRVRFLVGGCMAELTDVVVDGRPTRTIAVESEDGAAVTRAVHDLGLDGSLNTNYSRGLALALDEQPARYAVIDVGTNSVKFHLGERSDDGSWRTIVDRAEVTRLGEGLEERPVITPEALERTTAAIVGMADEARNEGALAIVAVGTAGLRIAQNRDDAIEAIRERTGVVVEVISGEEESRLAYVAVQAGLGLSEGPLVAFDTGGGSSQFTFGEGPRVDERYSVEVGAVRYTEQYGLDGVVSNETLRTALGAISDDLSPLDGRPIPDALVGMGGAITNITAVSYSLATYEPDVVQGAILDRGEIARQIERYRSMDAMSRRSIVGLQPKRADVILAGACIVGTVMDKLSQESLTVSDRGLRHGLAVERFGAALTP
ncbi:MAG: Ppx/GppA family phosphatase [Actinomycetota bacterium]|nr:Ppx/GppA family phosphatase [Actinomycetota bacterium]